MRDPFDAQPFPGRSSRQSSGEFPPQAAGMLPSTAGYMIGNGDWTPNSDSLIRHQPHRESGNGHVRSEESNSLMDPELTELCARSRSQEEEIITLRKQIADAGVQELQLLKEKHVLERRLADLRIAMDEKQDDAISDALKDLTQRKGYIEENVRIAHDLQVAEEDLYIFTSSLLSLLAEYDIRLPVLNASTIVTSTKRLCQNIERRIRSFDDSLDNQKHLLGNQPGDATFNNDRQPPTFSEPQLSETQLGSRTTDLQYGRYPVDDHVELRPNQTRFSGNYYEMGNANGVKTAPNTDLRYRQFSPNPYREIGGNTNQPFHEEGISDTRNRRGNTDPQFHMPTSYDRQTSPDSEGEVSSPGIEGFQIIGEAKPGNTLLACGFPTNGTSLCIFQWVRHLENGTRQSIEGATMPEYVVTADDVGTFLAMDCTPMDESGRQGELVSLFANNQNKITCDPDMQHEIDTYVSAGRAAFAVLLLMEPSENWEQANLILKRTGYQIKLHNTEAVVMEEKYSPDLNIKVPHGQTTQFVLISSEGAILPFSTSGTSPAYNPDDEIRLRDTIVLIFRLFQAKAVDGKRKGKA